MNIRTLIVDDEPLAREWVRNGLENEADVEIIGECGDGFKYDRPFMAWLKAAVGKTMGDAADEWHRRRAIT